MIQENIDMFIADLDANMTEFGDEIISIAQHEEHVFVLYKDFAAQNRIYCIVYADFRDIYTVKNLSRTYIMDAP